MQTTYLFAKFCISETKCDRVRGTKRQVGAAASGKGKKKTKLQPGVTFTASGKSLSRSLGLDNETRGVQNEGNIKEALKRMHGKKEYDDALYAAWALLIQWGEADMNMPPKVSNKWKTVEQQLIADGERVYVPPGNNARGGGAAAFNSCYMHGGGFNALYGVDTAFGVDPGGFGPGGFAYAQQYTPQNQLYPQMQQ